MKTEEFINLLGQSYTISKDLTGSIGVGSGGTINVSTGTGTATANPHQFIVRSSPPVTTVDVLQHKYPVDTSKAAVDQIEHLIHLLENTEEQNQQSAVKHLTYAKAFLEKMLLDKINQKTNGHS